MALLIEGRNPDDGNSTYNQMEFHRASSETGSYTLQSTVSIDTTTRTDLSPGYTSWTDDSGSSSYWYKIRWKASASGAASSFSDTFQGGTTILDSQFRRRMRDTNSSNYFFTNADVEFFRKDAIYSLWPSTWHEAIDGSLSTDGSTKTFNFPNGVTRINKVQLLDSSSNVAATLTDYEVASRQMLFPQAPANGYTFRLYVDKMFLKAAEVPEVFDSYLLDFMCFQAYKVLEADRSKYYRYNAVVKPEGGNLPGLRFIIERLEVSLTKRLNSLRRVRKPSFIGLQG